ncbi:putative salivary secreted peptide [Augochlora pura]
MTSRKMVLCLMVVFVAIATEVASLPNNCTIGYFEPADKIVFAQDVRAQGSGILVKTVTKTFNMRQWEKITMIQAVDMSPKGDATCDHSIRSGAAYVTVTFKFTSPRNQGLNFNLQIYGV